MQRNSTLNIKKFEEFVHSLGIKWNFSADEKGLMNYCCFVGPEHKKIQDSISLDDMITWLKTLSDIKKIWNDFGILMAMTKECLQGQVLKLSKKRQNPE